jgi:hypothetical protein
VRAKAVQVRERLGTAGVRDPPYGRRISGCRNADDGFVAVPEVGYAGSAA